MSDLRESSAVRAPFGFLHTGRSGPRTSITVRNVVLVRNVLIIILVWPSQTRGSINSCVFAKKYGPRTTGRRRHVLLLPAADAKVLSAGESVLFLGGLLDGSSDGHCLGFAAVHGVIG